MSYQIEKNFLCYKMSLISTSDSITMVIKKKNSNDEFTSNFTLSNLKKYKFFLSSSTPKNIIDIILRLIDKNLFKIKEEENEIIINFIITIQSSLNSNIELKLKKKLLFFKNLKNIKTIKAHSNSISSISVFPLGNLVSVSKDKSINIYDNNFNIIQTIINAHDSKITYVDVKDENNFVTCSNDKKIKIWIKKGKKFELGKIIKNTHNNYIYKVIYCLNGNIISCSEDSTIKLWEYSNLNNKFQCITVLKCNDKIKSILLLEEKNILISSGYGRADIFNKNSLKLLYTINNISCYSSNALKKLDDDKIIFGGGYDKIMKVLSLKEKKIIKEIDNKIICYGICVVENKGFFLTGGFSSEIKIYRNDSFDCIKIIQESHEFIGNGWLGPIIFGFVHIKNRNIIISYSNANYIKVWLLET